MNYYINLGGIILYGITGVSDESGRDITTYDGIGQGNFPVAESENLRSWTIECELTETNQDNRPNWSAASKIFTAFEVLLKTKESSRFIFVSEHRSESLLVLLENYSKKETYSGVYDVSIKVTEYKITGIKTTSIPYIKRPGKAPTIPKTVTISKKNTPYSVAKKISKGSKTSSSGSKSKGGGGMASKTGGVGRATVTKAKTGKPVANPATMNAGEKYAYSVSNSVINGSVGKIASKAGSALSAIGKSIGNFFKKIPVKIGFGD